MATQLCLFDYAAPPRPPVTVDGGQASPAIAPNRGASARRHHSGLAAEEIAARAYESRGCTVLARRHRTPEGEIDLILRDGVCLVFAEVKHRRRGIGADSPITARQWRRLGNAALWYTLNAQETTGASSLCRFDAVLIGPGGS